VADLDLVRDVLDAQIVDACGRAIGKADGIAIELRDQAPPRVRGIDVGLPVLGHRLHPALGRLLTRLNRWMRLPDDGCLRVPFDGLEVRPTGIRVPIDAAGTGALAWEEWLRRHVVARLPGGGPGARREEEER
jgi:hypothetical protein